MRQRPVRRILAATGAVLLLAALASPAAASRTAARPSRAPAAVPSSRASVDPVVLERLDRRGAVEVLVSLDGSAALSSARVAAASGGSTALLRSTVPAYRGLKDALRSRMPGLRVLRDYRTLPILLVRVGSRAELARLTADPAVAGVGADRRHAPTLAQSLPLIGQPTVAAAGHTGAGVSVAVLDTGVDYTRSAFGDCSGGPGSAGCKVADAQEFAPNDGQLDDPAIMHGTNVAGIVVGVAPDSRVLAYDVFDGFGAFDSDIIDAINESIANQAAFNVRAINMSLGSSTYNTSPCGGASNPYVAAFSNARAAGIIPVVATGNSRFSSGSNHVGIANPACTPGALPVGAVYDGNNGGLIWGPPGDTCTDATTAADQITCFSQAWANTLMLAPGALIDAAGITQGGTSQATPHVAGAVAVLHDAAGVTSAFGALAATPDQVQTALMSSGPSIFDPLVNMSFHRLDLPAAVAALGTTPPPPPPTDCTISGDAGDNFLQGTAGDDVICGEGGNDTLVPSGGNDLVIGGPGFDWVSLENATGSAAIDLAAGTAVAPGMSVTLQEMEGAIGSQFDDTLLGDGQQNDLFGFGGNDLLNGKGGFDYARFDFATAAVTGDLTNGVATGEGTDQLVAIEGLVGGAKSDELVGNNKGNFLYGLKGNDLLAGFGKPDSLFGGPGRDNLFGGKGNDDMFGGPGSDFCDQGPGSGVSSSC
jgi:Ca2+-binding RTX toxin-like protein